MKHIITLFIIFLSFNLYSQNYIITEDVIMLNDSTMTALKEQSKGNVFIVAASNFTTVDKIEYLESEIEYLKSQVKELSILLKELIKQ